MLGGVTGAARWVLKAAEYPLAEATSASSSQADGASLAPPTPTSPVQPNQRIRRIALDIPRHTSPRRSTALFPISFHPLILSTVGYRPLTFDRQLSTAPISRDRQWFPHSTQTTEPAPRSSTRKPLPDTIPLKPQYHSTLTTSTTTINPTQPHSPDKRNMNPQIPMYTRTIQAQVYTECDA